jgi:hypothetical protein
MRGENCRIQGNFGKNVENVENKKDQKFWP